MDLTVIVSIATAIFTIACSFFIARWKGKTDSFKSIIDANETFRNEVRKDLLQSKKELETASRTVTSLREQVEKLRKDLQAAEGEIITLKQDLGLLREEKQALIEKLLTYEAEIKRLQVLVVHYERQSADQQLVIQRLEKELAQYRK